MGTPEQWDALMAEDALFAVRWNDGVANEWVEIIKGPFEDTDNRLIDLRDIGRDEGQFNMEFLCLSQCIGADDLRVEPGMTAEAFFALPWEDSFQNKEVKRRLLEALGRI